MINDGGFAHLVLTTQWNLMCRSKSVQTIDLAHLRTEDESIDIVLHKTQSNQDASGPKDPRHLYANPFSPATCWVTTLAVYLACNPMRQPGQLFPGSNQKGRFLRGLGRSHALAVQPVKLYGTHSVRKGTATFACSGSTGRPSIVSVCLRCGWSLSGVQDRYIRYESADDEYLGRVIAGLPINEADFTVLPPHFHDPSNEDVKKCVARMFPTLKNVLHMQPILALCLASLAHHSNYLTSELPKPLLRSASAVPSSSSSSLLRSYSAVLSSSSSSSELGKRGGVFFDFLAVSVPISVPWR